MSAQTVYNTFMDQAFAGMIGDENPFHSRAYLSGEASAEMPFGIVLAKKSGDSDLRTAVIPATNATLPILGVLMHSVDYAVGGSYGVGSTGVKPKEALNVMTRGCVWVLAEGTPAFGDPVHVRYAGTGQKGAVRAVHVNAETFKLTNARFLTGAVTALGVTIALIEFDVLGGATAGATS